MASRPLKGTNGNLLAGAASGVVRTHRRLSSRGDWRPAAGPGSFQRARLRTGVARPASRFSAEAIDDQSTTASTRPSASPLSRTAPIGAAAWQGRVELVDDRRSTWRRRAWFDRVLGTTAFVRTGERLTSANSRSSSAAVSAGSPHFFLLALIESKWTDAAKQRGIVCLRSWLNSVQ